MGGIYNVSNKCPFKISPNCINSYGEPSIYNSSDVEIGIFVSTSYLSDHYGYTYEQNSSSMNFGRRTFESDDSGPYNNGIAYITNNTLKMIITSFEKNNLGKSFIDYTDVCLGKSSNGKIYITFVAIDSTYEKGVYIVYLDNKTVNMIANVSNDGFGDFPFPPSCFGDYISFYAYSNNSGIYVTNILSSNYQIKQMIGINDPIDGEYMFESPKKC